MPICIPSTISGPPESPYINIIGLLHDIKSVKILITFKVSNVGTVKGMHSIKVDRAVPHSKTEVSRDGTAAAVPPLYNTTRWPTLTSSNCW